MPVPVPQRVEKVMQLAPAGLVCRLRDVDAGQQIRYEFLYTPGKVGLHLSAVQDQRVLCNRLREIISYTQYYRTLQHRCSIWSTVEKPYLGRLREVNFRHFPQESLNGA